METENEIKRYVTTVVKPIFNKVLQEASKNQMLVGFRGHPKTKKCLYQPHNYRLYIDFSRESYDSSLYIKTKVLPLVEKKTINSNEILYKYEKYTLKVKKNTIEITNKTDFKKWFVITLSDKGEEEIRKIITRKDRQAISFVKKWIKAHGGKSEFKILNRHSENKIKAEDSINLIPIKQKWHNKVSKKVYNENSVEFYDPALASNYILNRGIESISPQIAEELSKINNNLIYTNPLRVIKKKIKKATDILNYPELVRILTQEEKEELEFYLMELEG